MPKGKPTRAKAKRPAQPTRVDSMSNGSLACPQLESIFKGFYHAQDVISVCRLALERVASPEDNDIANVLSSTVLVRMDYHLRKLDRLIRSFGGSTAYSDDDEEIDDAAYSEVAKEGSSDE
jgi:hypothetical protein